MSDDEDKYIESLIKSPWDDMPVGWPDNPNTGGLDVPSFNQEFPTEAPGEYDFDLQTEFLIRVECRGCSVIHEEGYDLAITELADAQRDARRVFKRYGWKHVYDEETDRYEDYCDECLKQMEEE